MFYTLLGFTQSIDTQYLINLKTSNIGKTEKKLTLNNWSLTDLKEVEDGRFNPYGAYKSYYFLKENYLNNIIAEIIITIYERDKPKDIIYKTKEKGIYKK